MKEEITQDFGNDILDREISASFYLEISINLATPSGLGDIS